MEFERKTPGTRICRCELDEEARQLKDSNQVWVGGEHLVSVVPNTDVHMHYYPDRRTHTITILKIENVEAGDDVASNTDG